MSSDSSASIWVGWKHDDFMLLDKVVRGISDWEEDDQEDLYQVTDHFNLSYHIFYDGCDTYLVGEVVISVDWEEVELTPEVQGDVERVTEKLHKQFGEKPKVYLCSGYF